MLSPPSSFNLFLFSALLVAWLTPISAWWSLHGEKDRKAKIWFLGTAIYACAVTMFVLGPSEIIYPHHALVHLLTLMSVLCTYEALRNDLEETDAPWIKYLGLIIFEQSVLAIFEFFDIFRSYGMALHHSTLSFIELLMLFKCIRLHHFFKSRSILVVITALICILFANIARVIIFMTTGIYPNLNGHDFISYYSTIVNYLSLIFFCYGYWGFLGDKYRTALNKAINESFEAKAGELKAQQEKKFSEIILKERMVMTDSLISLAQNIRSGAVASSIVHELTQPLAALKLRIDQLLDDVGRSLDPTEVNEQINKIKLDVEVMIGVALKTRDVFTLSEPEATVGPVGSLLSGCLEKSLARWPVAGLVVEKEFSTAPLIKASFEELDMAFGNLFDNALKALSQVPPERRALHLKAWQGQDFGIISIMDTGEGMPLHIKDRMFDINVSSHKNSMGLGLWLSRYIIERNGGRVRYNEFNKLGTEFIIQLPAVDHEQRNK